MKDELEGVAWHLVAELEQHFLKHEVMIALDVVYSQFMGYKHAVYSQSSNFFEGHFFVPLGRWVIVAKLCQLYFLFTTLICIFF